MNFYAKSGLDRFGACLKRNVLFLLLLAGFSVSSVCVCAAQPKISVTGTVLNEAGEPMIGVKSDRSHVVL